MAQGGIFRLGRPTTDPSERLLLDGEPLAADRIIVATGAWMGRDVPADAWVQCSG